MAFARGQQLAEGAWSVVGVVSALFLTGSFNKKWGEGKKGAVGELQRGGKCINA